MRTAVAAVPGSPLAGRDALLLDLDGVLYTGSAAVPGAAAAVARARAEAMPVRFVTNNASRPPEAVAARLGEAGVEASAVEVVTSAQVAAHLLAERLVPGAGPIGVVGGAGLHAALSGAGLDPVPVTELHAPPVAVVQGFDPSTGWTDLAAAARWLQTGVHWLATNLDLTIPLESAIAPGNGALVRAVALAAGRDPDEVAGKPSPAPFLRAARDCGARRPVVVGDRLDTDVAGGRAAGALTALVLTGVHGLGDAVAAPPQERPDIIVRGLGELWQALPEPGPVEPGPGGSPTVRCGRATVSWSAADGLEADDSGPSLETARAVLTLAHDLVDRGAAEAARLREDPVIRDLDVGLRVPV